LINLDFADVRTIMSETGPALMGVGQGSGENRTVEAAKAATSSPLLETSIEGARGVLINVTGGTDLGLYEVNEAADIIASFADPDANIIFGAVIDENCQDQVRVTVIATGFRTKQQSGFKPTLASVGGGSAYSRGENLDSPAWSRWQEREKIVNE
jgi:cell division protein FtsZ